MRCLALAAVVAWGPVAAGQTFLDVPPGSVYFEAVEAVTAPGGSVYMEGCGGSFFCPDGPVTREDMAVWLERALHGPGYVLPGATGEFSDVPAGYCLAPWIEQLHRDGVTAGCSPDPPRYCPYHPVTRAQMAVFLLVVEHHGEDPPYAPPPCRGVFQDVPCPGYWAAPWIEALYDEGITAGCSVDPPLYCPEASVTRAQMAAFLAATLGLVSSPEHG